MTDAVASASERIFVELRRQIMTGELPPGSRHSVYAIADRVQASRTPVREAVLRLADLHLVTIQKNRGIVIRRVEPAQIDAIFEMRLLVEGAGVMRAARSADAAAAAHRTERSALTERMRAACREGAESDFVDADRAWHGLLVGALDNTWADRQIDTLRSATPPSLDRVTPRGDRLRAILDEHAAIEAAIRRGDAPGAHAALRLHLSQTARSLLSPETLADLGARWPERLQPDVPPHAGG